MACPLCSKCLSLLSEVITKYGDGTNYKDLKLSHSSFELIFDSNKTSTSCVICAKALALFDIERTLTTFKSQLRNTPYSEWTMSWRILTRDPKIHEKFVLLSELNILIGADHEGGGGWALGQFKIYPDYISSRTLGLEHENCRGDYPIIGPLDLSDAENINGEIKAIDFSSTLSPGTLQLVSTWAKECTSSHQKCRSTGFEQPSKNWFPDRLIHIDRPANETMDSSVVAHLVLKSDLNESHSQITGIQYLSLSHCWGPAPDPSAPLGGRAGTVLTDSNLDVWRDNLPLQDLPLAFQHAIRACSLLGFEYIWIDSLCILQDSRQDWETQSAVMGDVYKYAWMNIAALSSTSDYEGFINDSRDPRVEFGFRTSFASILGREIGEKNSEGQECILLHGQAKLAWELWDWTLTDPGSSVIRAPLFTRAWVYQERLLARRTLVFAQEGVYWFCDEKSRGEQPDWDLSKLKSPTVREWLHTVLDTIKNLRDKTPEQRFAQMQKLLKWFDGYWISCIRTYTSCNLTKHTDKLIAFSSVARELASLKLIQKRYVAGLWDVNLPFQLAWITKTGDINSPRKIISDPEYVAPSWSWASIDAQVEGARVFPFEPTLIALADVTASDVELATDYIFGAVRSGWLRISSHQIRVTATSTQENYHTWGPKKSRTVLTEDIEGEWLDCSPDTAEGYKLLASGQILNKLIWVPLTLRFAYKRIECFGLVLLEQEEKFARGTFVREGEKVYSRLGSAFTCRSPSRVQQSKLMSMLGKFPDIKLENEEGPLLAKGFKKSQDGFRECVVI